MTKKAPLGKDDAKIAPFGKFDAKKAPLGMTVRRLYLVRMVL